MSKKSSTFAVPMTLMNDTLYNALQCFEMRLALQHNRCVEMPCRQIVRTSIEVASLMLRDEAVEHNRDAYLCLISRLMGGSQQERMMVLIVTIALLGMLDSPHARRCRNTLRAEGCEEFEECLSLYEQFLASSDTRFAEEDFMIDTHTAISRLLTEKQHLITENEQLKKTIHTMSKEKTIIHVAGNYIAEQNIDIHDNQNVYLGGAPSGDCEQSAEKEQREPGEHSSLFTKKAHTEGREGEIIQALQQSLVGRQDKARALVEEIRHRQREGYIDPHYNARVMYDELDKILNLPFQYGGFRKYYNE